MLDTQILRITAGVKILFDDLRGGFLFLTRLVFIVGILHHTVIQELVIKVAGIGLTAQGTVHIKDRDTTLYRDKVVRLLVSDRRHICRQLRFQRCGLCPQREAVCRFFLLCRLCRGSFALLFGRRTFEDIQTGHGNHGDCQHAGDDPPDEERIPLRRSLLLCRLRLLLLLRGRLKRCVLWLLIHVLFLIVFLFAFLAHPGASFDDFSPLL